MTYLITGGSGFIGTHLALALQQADESFRIIDKRASITFPDLVTLLDILDADRLAQSLSGHTIFHLAAEHRDDVKPADLYHRVNVEGTRNLCRAASLRGINRIVFTSSVAVYGFTRTKTNETGAINPLNAYGQSKFDAEQVLRAWAAEAPQTRSLTIIRPTVVFGPGNRGNVYTLFRQIALGRFVMVGRGENRKSLAYIDNLVAFLRHIAKAGPGVHLFNYVDTPDLTTRDLVILARKTLRDKSGTGPSLPVALGMALGHMADTFAALTGKSLPISAQRVRKFTTDSAFSSRAHGHQGFIAPISVEDGIRATLDAEFLNPKPHPVFYTE
jgi:nucleoside-diphosphate-sugar epimerase